MKTFFTCSIIAAALVLWSCRAHRIRLENAGSTTISEDMHVSVNKLSLGSGIILGASNKKINIDCGRLIINNTCTISAPDSVTGNTMTINFEKCSGRKKLVLRLGDNYFNLTQTNK